MRLTEVAQAWIRAGLDDGDIVIDATLGNGFDALFLAQSIGKNGHIFGFDVQEKAILESKKKLKSEPCQQSFFQVGHELMTEHIPQEYHQHISAIMFNLGWLPNSDKNIITKPETTIIALKQSLHLLSPNGRLSIMVYPGHQGGDTEAEQVIQWTEQFCKDNPAYECDTIILPNRPAAPILLQTTKLGS